MGPGVDTHVHVFDPNRFPYPDGPGYRPLPHESGTADDLAQILADGGLTHAVIVQPSGYGTDNAAVLDAIARSGGRHRGVAAHGRAVELDQRPSASPCSRLRW